MEQKRGAAAPLSWKTVTLELHLQRQLQRTRIRGAVHAGAVADRSVNAAGRAEIDVIHDIVGVHAELNRSSLTDWAALHHRQVHIEEVRPVEAISSQSSGLVQSGRCEYIRQRRRLKLVEGVPRCAPAL